MAVSFPQGITTEVIAAYKRKFDAIDLNKDGLVELKDMAAVSRVFGYKLSIAELREIFHKKDIDYSGSITFEQFLRAMLERRARNRRLAPVRDKFRRYDRKARGYFTAEEAHPILAQELGFSMSKTEGLVDMFDKNRDYKVSITEFVAFDVKVQELKADIMKGFTDFDLDGDGFVSLVEMKAVMVPKGFSERQVSSLLQKYDADGDGVLNYEEFARFWDVPLYN